MMFFSIKAEAVKTAATEQANGESSSAFAQVHAFEKERSFAFSTQSAHIVFYQRHRKNAFLFIESIAAPLISVAAFVKCNYLNDHSVEELAAEYFHLLDIQFRNLQVSEITWQTARSMLRTAYRKDYIPDDDETLNMLRLGELDCIDFSESLLSAAYSETELLAQADSLLCSGTLGAEIRRIYQGCAQTLTCGHPVHYLVQADSAAVRSQIIETLLSALYANGRIQSKRYCTVVFDQDDQPPCDNFRCLYEASIGGAVVVEYACGEESESAHARPATEIINRLCDTAQRFNHQVLTVFCLPRAAKRIKNSFLDHLGAITLVSLGEELVCGAEAKKYLRQLAKNAGVKADKKLYRNVSDPNRGYFAAELKREFDYWFSRQMKTVYYPQYAAMEAADMLAAKRAPSGSAYDELTRMVGLHEAKAVIGQALDYYKARRLFRDKGMQWDNAAMHMVFTGNPGTAKTTAARLFARIMKENGLLSVGDLVEVGRADLVGKYVGWTAPTVRKYFEAAKGSVLFIDEAYSLVDDKAGLYGDEAINTIVQEMENRRDDMAVIFAGYPQQMDQFLQRNPGLRSRIAFHVPFADYSATELYDILLLLAQDHDLTPAPPVRNQLLPLLAAATRQPDFGNGRYVRNLLEHARLRQASRLVKLGAELATTEDVHTLVVEDFDVDAGKAQMGSERRLIGFSA